LEISLFRPRKSLTPPLTSARAVLEFAQRASQVVVSQEEKRRDLPEDRLLNRKLVADSTVLLKHNAGVLLLPKDVKEIALIGPSLKNTAYCVGGFASLEPYYLISPYHGILSRVGKDGNMHYEVGAPAHGYLPTLSPSVWVTPEGQPGGRVRFYREPPSVSSRETIDETIVLDSVWELMGFSHPRLDKLFYADIEGFFTAPETAEFEFGLAVYGSASLFIDDKLVTDNTTKQNSGRFFFGKGTIEEKQVVELVQGQSYKIKVEFGSLPTAKLVQPGIVQLGSSAGRLRMVSVIDEDEAIARAVKLAKENKHNPDGWSLSKFSTHYNVCTCF
jgi:beta-glucosidase